VHVTLRASVALRCLRSARVFPAVRGALAKASRDHFRVVEYSVQTDHIHCLAEASDTRSLASGVRGLAVRLARAINRALGRRGRVWSDRYHARPLTSPRTVRNALVYVLMNSKKHGQMGTDIDPCFSPMVLRLACTGCDRGERTAASRSRTHLARARGLAAAWPD
jgi:REP element-mobilizing transposase RayT